MERTPPIRRRDLGEIATQIVETAAESYVFAAARIDAGSELECSQSESRHTRCRANVPGNEACIARE